MIILLKFRCLWCLRTKLIEISSKQLRRERNIVDIDNYRVCQECRARHLYEEAK